MITTMEGWIVKDVCSLAISFSSHVTLLQLEIYSKEVRFFPSFFFKTTGAPLGGFHPNCLSWAPPRGFHVEIFYSIFFRAWVEWR